MNSPIVNQSGKVFVTVQMLQARLAGSGGDLHLAANEILTPAARDIIDARHISVKRDATFAAAPVQPVIALGPARAVAQLVASAAMPSDRPTVGAVGLVLDRPNEQVEALLGALRYDGAAFVDCNKADCWAANLDSLAGAIASGNLTVGVAIMPYAADAMVIAGKISGLRPVQGVSAQAVAAGVRHFNANVLVLGYKASTFGQMRAMIRTFTAARSSAGVPAIMAAIEERDKR